MSSATEIPVIAIDGPSGSGKGTVAEQVAQALGFHYLDSGAIYRVAALAARRAGAPLDDEDALATLAERLNFDFRGGRIYLDGADVTREVRTEATGNDASRIAAFPRLRAALLARQRAFRRSPGLVADGRDIGSIVFPAAALKIFLTASIAARGERRYKQLKHKGLDASMPDILRDLGERDERDSARSAAPLKKCADASLLDTTSLTIDEAVAQVLERYQAVLGQLKPARHDYRKD